MNSNHWSLARKEPVSVGKANCGFETGFQSRGTDGSNPSPSSGESDANLTSKLVRFAFVDDNAVDLTVIDRKSPELPDD